MMCSSQAVNIDRHVNCFFQFVIGCLVGTFKTIRLLIIPNGFSALFCIITFLLLQIIVFTYLQIIQYPQSYVKTDSM